MATRLLSAVVLLSLAASARAATPADALMQAIEDARPAAPEPLAPMHATPCVNGFAGAYPCSNIDLLAFEPVANFGATTTNSLWGWTDPQTNIEYALVGANNRTAFYDLSTPDHPRYVGWLPTHTGSSIWRDVRVYANHAYVVADNNGAHGMQVFNLALLRGVTTPTQFAETAWYNGATGNTITNVHTIAINEQTGYAYLPGSTSCGGGGLHMVDIRIPANPVFAGCGSTGHYVHESQCWNYAGPDATYAGHEICVEANGPTDRIALVDVTNKAAPVTLASAPYAGSGYPHQGWLTEDHRYLLVNDELDESSLGHNARTYVWDVSDLDNPVLKGYHQHALGVIDHNLYLHGNYVYESNYESGVRILELDNLSQAKLKEVAYFDTYPNDNSPNFNGSWNNYRFPGSGIVIATGIDEGFFVLEPQLCAAAPAPAGLSAAAAGDNRIDLAWSAGTGTAWRVERAQGGCGGNFTTIADDLASTSFSDTSASGTVNYGYRVSARAGTCASPASTCVEAQAPGQCTAAPLFAGVASAQSPGTANCRVDLGWSSAAPACGSASYNVYRGSASGFVPAPGNRIAQGVAGTGFADASAVPNQRSWYVVRAVDSASGAEDANATEREATAVGPLADGTFATGAEPGETILDSTADAQFEAGKSLATPKHIGWHTNTVRKHGGIQSFWSTRSTNLCVSLVTPPIALTAGQSTQLSWWQAFDIRAGDGAVLEVSTNGTNWTRLTPIGGYGGTVSATGGTLCGIAQGAAAFVGQNTNPTFAQKSIDLSAYAGQTVQVRWLYRTDAGTTTASLGEGWFVDDIALSHAQVPGTCAALPDALFSNGFE
mgnify:CR=1 FL=1